MNNKKVKNYNVCIFSNHHLQYYIKVMNQKVEVVLKSSCGFAKKFDKEVQNELTRTNFQGYINLIHGRWSELKDNISLIESWGVKTLNLQSNQQINIIQQLSEINFPSLIHLNLRLNRIQNLQPLIWLRAPLLNQLMLDSNQFFYINPIIKCFFPFLKQISLAANKINDIEKLAELQCPLLERVYLQWFVGTTSNCDIGFFSKLESNSMLNIWMQHPQRIIQVKVLKSLKQKYPKIRFQTFAFVNLN